MPNIAGPARIVPLRSLENTDVSYEALRQAARRGTLEAERGSDGIWRSSGHAVEKQFDVRPRGWRTAAGAYGDAGSHRSVADVVDPGSLQKVRAFKKEQKALARAASEAPAG